MRLFRWLVGAVMMLGVVAIADQKTDEATARLKAREAERAAAATRPAAITQEQLDKLRSDLDVARGQLAAARDEIEKLKSELAKSRARQAKPVPPDRALVADGPGVYEVFWNENGPGNLPLPHTASFKARNRETALDIAKKKNLPLQKAYDADGNERVTNCRKVKDLDDSDL